MASQSSCKYRAFISYSHQDRGWATSFHKALEAFRIPRELIGKEARYGPVPKSLFPIFRDREELPTSSNLSEAIVAALEDSLYLIVVCSPAAARSLWVSEEILAFKRMGRSDRILPIIIEGEPNASDRGDPDLEAFPKPLRFALGPDGKLSEARAEPVAADARPQADGPLDARLKVIAGLLGVNFNDLKRRELVAARRRARISQAIAGGMAMLALVAVFFGVRSELQRRQISEQNSALLLRESKLLAAEASELALNGEGVKAASTALSALPEDFAAPERPIAAEAVGALMRAVRTPSRSFEIRGPVGGRPKAAHVSYDDQQLLVAGSHHVAELWALKEEPTSLTVTQSTADATSVLFQGERGKRFVILIWGTIGPGSLSLYEEQGSHLELKYTISPEPIGALKVMQEEKDWALLMSKDYKLFSFEKTPLPYSYLAETDPNMGLEKFLNTMLVPHPQLLARQLVAVDLERRLALIHADDDAIVVENLDKGGRKALTAPGISGYIRGDFSADGDRVAFFSPNKNESGERIADKGLILNADGSGAPLDLNMAADYRCSRTEGQPRFRDGGDYLVARDGENKGICVWSTRSGALVDRVPIPLPGNAPRMEISPRGNWVLTFDDKVPVRLWSTQRLLRFENSASAEEFEAVNFCKRETDFGTDVDVCSAAPQGGIEIDEEEGTIRAGAERDPNWRALMPWLSSRRYVLSPSGRYLAVVTPGVQNDNHRKRAEQGSVGLMDLTTRKIVCRAELDRQEIQDLRSAFVFDAGPSLFAVREYQFGPPHLAKVPCNGDAHARLNWVFQHGRNGDTGTTTIVSDARISRDGRRLLTVANDRTWRLWDVASGIELVRGAAEGSGSFDVTPEGKLALVSGTIDVEWQRIALPPSPSELAERLRRAGLHTAGAGGD